jgi:hypothetical protein
MLTQELQVGVPYSWGTDAWDGNSLCARPAVPHHRAAVAVAPSRSTATIAVCATRSLSHHPADSLEKKRWRRQLRAQNTFLLCKEANIRRRGVNALV